MLKNMKVGSRLSLGFGFLIVLAVALFGFLLQQMSAIKQSTDAVIVGQWPQYVAMSAVQESVVQVKNDALAAVARNQADEVSRLREQWAAAQQQNNARLEQVLTLAATPAGREFARKVQDDLKHYAQAQDAVLRAMGSSSVNEPLNAQLLPQEQSLENEIGKFKVHITHVFSRATDASSTIYRHAMLNGVLIVALALLLTAAMAFVITRSITKPLDAAIEVVNRVAQGDLTGDIDVLSADEIGKLLRALAAMTRNLKRVVEQVRTSSVTIAAATAQSAEGNLDLSSRTEEQAASLEQTAASVTELTQTVKQSADNARQARALATSATDLAETGNDAVQEMVETIERISGGSSKISEITGVIEGIAFQTNILALNAAVEAARAGEHGRGFAVVASEVRSLAQRAASAAREIKSLIESSVASVRDGSRQAEDVGATMLKVKQSIKQVSDIVGEIAAASEVQSRGIEQVHQALDQMDTVTQQNAALVAEVAAAAQSLDDQAKNLNEAVSVFHLSDAGEIHSMRRQPVPDGIADQFGIIG